MSARAAALVLATVLLATQATAVPAPAAGAAATSCGGRAATVVGTDGRDRLRGTPGPDVIAGLGGNDEISGLGGDDVLCGGDGADTLLGGAGDDRLLGGADQLVQDEEGSTYLRGDTLDGGDGDDVLVPGLDPRHSPRLGGLEHVSWRTSSSAVRVRVLADGRIRATGAGGTDVVRGHRDVTVTGSPYADHLVGSARRDYLDGGNGPDVLEGRQGDDELVPDGYRGDGKRDDDRVYGGTGDDTVYSDAGRDLVVAGPGDDRVTAFDTSSVLRGNAGDDELVTEVSRRSGWAADGGAGRDTVLLGLAGDLQDTEDVALLSIDQSTGRASLRRSGGAVSTGSVASLEKVEIFAPVRLDYVGSEADEVLRVQYGLTAIQLGRIHADMGAGNDVVRGSCFRDLLDGGPGRDRADGLGGVDRCPRTEVRVSCS